MYKSAQRARIVTERNWNRNALGMKLVSITCLHIFFSGRNITSFKTWSTDAGHHDLNDSQVYRITTCSPAAIITLGIVLYVVC